MRNTSLELWTATRGQKPSKRLTTKRQSSEYVSRSDPGNQPTQDHLGSKTMGRIIGFLFYWGFVFSWRFFTGAHMNGQTYNDSTWWQDASSMYRKRRPAYTWWRKKSRMKRAAWRHSIFWPVILVTWGLIFFTSSAVIILLCFAPGLSLIAGKKLRLAWYLPIVAHNSDGSVRQHWVLKPKLRRRLDTVWHPRDKRKRPGLALHGELRPGIQVEEIPADYEAAVRAELAEELDRQPDQELKLLLSPEDFTSN